MGGFIGLRVLSLESRRGREIAQLIRNQGGEPVVAPSVAEVPARQNDDARRFMSALRAGEISLAIFTTGVGTRALAESRDCPRDEFVTGLKRIPVIARSGKPGTVLRELGIPIAATAPEPNTYLEVLALLDRDPQRFPLTGRQVAIQEHGEISHELHDALAERGARVMPVVVYEWSMPEGTAPLRDAVERIARADIDVALFTATIQVRHLVEIADQMKQREQLLAGLRRAVVCSIGPVTSAELRHHSIEIDVEPEHPRMGFLVAKAAADARAVLARKRS